mmetsp:Transcript_100235/g.278958  ORF Transcript_100235/g.278958 Transcript_100235/m.278958 type:complete len:219 (-) Transcript_100235:614-1270(-)
MVWRTALLARPSSAPCCRAAAARRPSCRRCTCRHCCAFAPWSPRWAPRPWAWTSPPPRRTLKAPTWRAPPTASWRARRRRTRWPPSCLAPTRTAPTTTARRLAPVRPRLRPTAPRATWPQFAACCPSRTPRRQRRRRAPPAARAAPVRAVAAAAATAFAPPRPSAMAPSRWTWWAPRPTFIRRCTRAHSPMTPRSTCLAPEHPMPMAPWAWPAPACLA